jgi:hypothetical protein
MLKNRNLAVLALMLFFAARQGVGGVEDILGKWVAKAQTPNGPLEMEFELKMEGNQLMGSAAAFQGSFPLNGLKFEDPNLSLEMNLGGMNFRLTGLLKEGRFSGKWEQVGTEVQGTWTAERKAAAAATATAGGITGAWSSVAVTSQGELLLALDLKQDGEKITGTVSSELGSLPIQNATFKGDTLQFDIDLNGTVYRTNAAFKDDKFSGRWVNVGTNDGGAWSATRKVAPPPSATAAGSFPLEGTWNAVAETPDGPRPFQLVLKQSGTGISATIVTPEGNIPIPKAAFANNLLTLEVEFGGGSYRIEASLANGKLAGKWSSASGSESGAWSAERKSP